MLRSKHGGPKIKKMRKAAVYRNQVFAGTLTELDNQQFVFEYDLDYLTDTTNKSISLTLPKRSGKYTSAHLFPCFFNLLSEGINKQIQNRQHKIDEADYFGLLLATAHTDTIGAITVKSIGDE